MALVATTTTTTTITMVDASSPLGPRPMMGREMNKMIVYHFSRLAGPEIVFHTHTHVLQSDRPSASRLHHPMRPSATENLSFSFPPLLFLSPVSCLCSPLIPCHADQTLQPGQISLIPPLPVSSTTVPFSFSCFRLFFSPCAVSLVCRPAVSQSHFSCNHPPRSHTNLSCPSSSIHLVCIFNQQRVVHSLPPFLFFQQQTGKKSIVSE